jgi:sigma-B regulation protein RsbU (phosphoserine phosphatase)
LKIENASERISRVIFEYAARIGQAQDTDALLRLNADMARDLVGAERCSIWLIDAEAGQIHTTVAHGVGEIRVERGHGLVGACIAQGEPIVVNNASADERFLNRIDQDTGFETQSVLAIPLRTADGTIIGAFQALNRSGGFNESDVALLGFAASYSAAAIETQRLRQEAEAARLFLHELEIARDVQSRLIPEGSPPLEGLDCATFFRPAKFVGGDYYDLLETPNGTLAFTLGDVSGKGIPAAVVMASIQASLRIPLLQGPESLTGLVATVNNSIQSTFLSEHYSTLFCGLVNCQNRRLIFLNAGHCPPMLVRRNGEEVTINRLMTGGLPIGLLPGTEYEEEALVLDSGDLLVCFSDGLSEAMNEHGEMWRESEIEAILCENQELSAREIIDRLVAAADAFAGAAEQADDMSVVALRIR